MRHRTCPHCHQSKPLTAYARTYRPAHSGRRLVCRHCRKLAELKRYRLASLAAWQQAQHQPQHDPDLPHRTMALPNHILRIRSHQEWREPHEFDRLERADVAAGDLGGRVVR